MRARHGEALAFVKAIAYYEGSNCVLWPFGINKLGYGRVLWNGVVISASTAVCEEAHGPRPPTAPYAAHECGNKLCVNPEYLRWSTGSLNHGDDRLRHGTHNRGVRNGQNKLAETEVKEIRARAAGSRAHSRALGISWSTYQRIRNRQRWGWL